MHHTLLYPKQASAYTSSETSSTFLLSYYTYAHRLHHIHTGGRRRMASKTGEKEELVLLLTYLLMAVLAGVRGRRPMRASILSDVWYTTIIVREASPRGGTVDVSSVLPTAKVPSSPFSLSFASPGSWMCLCAYGEQKYIQHRVVLQYCNKGQYFFFLETEKRFGLTTRLRRVFCSSRLKALLVGVQQYYCNRHLRPEFALRVRVFASRHRASTAVWFPARCLFIRIQP